MSKTDNAISHSLAASTEAVIRYKDKTNSTRPASIMIRKEEDKKWQHALVSSDDNNGSILNDEGVHYTRYYEYMIVTSYFLVLMMNFGIGNSWHVIYREECYRCIVSIKNIVSTYSYET